MTNKYKGRTPAESIIAGLDQAISWASGESVPVRETTVQIPKVDVKQLRKKLHLSQGEFAGRFGFAPATVRNWEQGRRQPEVTARILLAIIDRHPEAVEDVLHTRA